MNKIRLGVVRADTHGYYFGMMIDDLDPLKLSKTNYVIHYYGTSIYDPKITTMPKVSGFEIVNVFDKDLDMARGFSETFHGKPKVCKTLEETAEDIDAVFIADCDGGGMDHLELARPFLKKGLPTFVDKPFATTLKDAKEIVRLAKENNVLLYNSSILSVVPAADHFRNRFAEISHAYYPVPAEKSSLPIGLGVIKGVGGAFSQELAGKPVTGGIEERLAYIIHGVSLALNLFGKDVEWVEAMGSLPLEYLHLHMASGVEAMVLNTAVDIFPEYCNFYVSAYSKHGAVHSSEIGDHEFLGGGQRIMENFRDMINSGKPPVSHNDMIRPIAVVEAGQLAQMEGRKVYLKDVWQEQ